MPRTSTLVLRIREADEADYGSSVIRIHRDDKPKDLNWGDRIDLSIDQKNWITCKLEPSGDAGIGKIYIGLRLRGILNKDTRGTQIAQLGEPCKLYIRKEGPWKVLLYITLGIIAISVIASLVYSLYID